MISAYFISCLPASIRGVTASTVYEDTLFFFPGVSYPLLLPPRPCSLSHCAFLSSSRPLRFYCFFPLGSKVFCFPFLFFLYLLTICWSNPVNVLHVVFVLDLFVAFRATYPLSSPGVLASRREGLYFWFSCCFSSFTHPLLSEFSSRSISPLFS